MARKVVVEFVGEDRTLSRTTARAESRLGKLGDRMKSVGKAAAVGLAGGVAVAGVALFKMAEGAAEDAAGQARLAKAMKNAAGASKDQVAGVEDWITAQGKALGVADDQLRPALEKLVGATKDVGEAQRLTSLAMNVSAGTGKSLEQVSTALMKAQNGQVAGLSRLGISTKDAEGKVISFEEAQRRLAELHKGQAAKSANTLQGKYGRLKLLLSETGETIGSKLLPKATDLADWFLNDGLPKMEAFGAYLGEVLPPIFAKIQAVVSAVMSAVKNDVGGNIAGVKQIFTDAVSIIRSLWAAFGDNIVTYLRATFANVKTILSGAFTVIQGIFQTVAALLKGDWAGVWDGIKKILSGAVQVIVGLVKQLWNLVRFAFSNAGVALKAVVKAMWSGIKALVSAGIGAVVSAVTGLPGKLLALGGKFLTAGKNLMGKIFDGFKQVGKIGLDIGRNLFDGIRNGINKAIDGVNGFLPDKIKLKGLPDINLPDNPIPHIPALAKGGIVTRPTLAMIGEDGPEAVVPLTAKNHPTGAALGADPAATAREVERVVRAILAGTLLEQILYRAFCRALAENKTVVTTAGPGLPVDLLAGTS